MFARLYSLIPSTSRFFTGYTACLKQEKNNNKQPSRNDVSVSPPLLLFFCKYYPFPIAWRPPWYSYLFFYLCRSSFTSSILIILHQNRRVTLGVIIIQPGSVQCTKVKGQGLSISAVWCSSVHWVSLRPYKFFVGGYCIYLAIKRIVGGGNTALLGNTKSS